MNITPYLIFNGEAEEAAGFYADALGGKIDNLWRYSDMPANPEWQVPAGYENKVMHSCVSYPGGAMSIADTTPSDPRNFGNGGHVLTINCGSVAEAETAWKKLTAGARKINCPMQQVFYAERYGEAFDRYGVLWAVMYEGNRMD